MNKNKRITLFCLLLLGLFGSTAGMKAQVKPGNVSNTVELWLSNPDTTYKTIGEMHVWENQAGNPLLSFTDTFKIGGNLVGSAPTLNTSDKIMNFYPSLNFNGVAMASSPSGRYPKLVTKNLLQPEKSYHVFYVSEVEINSMALLLSPNLTTSGGSNSNYSGWNSGVPYFHTGNGSNTYSHPGNGKLYGVTAIMRPNNATTGQRAYLNGIEKTFDAKAMAIPTTNTLAFIGSAGAGSSNNFVGNIQEIIILSSPTTGNLMIAKDFDKISSYLALKYGITFKGSDYLNSDGKTVWSRTQNYAYDNYIFGLVRDEQNGKLHQKQASSYDAGNLIAFVSETTLTALPDFNYENNAVVGTDKTYLLFGSNGETGLVTYDAVQGGRPDMFSGEPVNQRTKEVWKAQFTTDGNSTSAEYHLNFKVPDATATYLLVSSSGQFPFSTTSAYKLTGKEARNVAVKNGDYISYTYGYSEGPGGVTNNLELWLKPDTIASSITSVATWADASGKERNFTQYSTATAPAFDKVNNLMNFQPSLLFPSSPTNIKLVRPTFFEANKAYHIFYVSRYDNPSSNATGIVFAPTVGGGTNVVGWNRTTGASGQIRPAFYTANNNPLYYHQGNTKDYGINLVSRPNAVVPQRAYFNGVRNTTSTPAKTMTGFSGSSVIGNNAVGSNSNIPFRGNLQEIIVLSGKPGEYLSDDEVVKVNTYLALKYGITLATGNYVSSCDVNIWTRSGNNGYDKNIFGIGRDDNSGLYVKQATSYDNSTLTVYLSNLVALNRDNNGTLEDNTFLILGSNGLSGIGAYAQAANTEFGNGTLFDKVDYRFKETFKTQMTGRSNMTVNLKVAEPEADILFVSSTANFVPSQTRFYNLTAGVAEGVLINPGDYIMYAFKTPPATGASYTKEIWLKAEDLSATADGIITNTAWLSAAGSYSFNRMGSPVLNTAENQLMNYQPSVKFSANSQYFTTGFAVNNAKSYYVFYVSEAKKDATDTQHIVLALGHRDGAYYTNASYNGWYKDNPSFTTDNYLPAQQQPFVQEESRAKNFGITAVIRPNTTTDYQSIYFNGIWQRKLPGTMTLSNYNAYIGRGNGRTSGNYYSFSGNIQEIIVLTSDTKGDIDLIEAQKVNSYLAIKYGLTLDAGDYILRDNTVVWSRAAAVDNTGVRYEKNIFGIGKHTESNIDQKQSRSYNPPYNAPFTVFLGNDVAPLNRDNAAPSLPDGSFVMFSADEEIRSIKPMKEEITAGTMYSNVPLPEDMNYITATYKVQITGAINLINIRKELSNDNCYLLVSSDPSFPSGGSTHLHSFSTSILSNIPINNGDYLAIITQAKPAPGGIIDGLRLWMRPDMGADYIHIAGDSIDYWKSYTDNDVVYEYYTEGIPTGSVAIPQHYRPHYLQTDPKMNYHSSVLFNIRKKLGGNSDDSERNNATTEYLSTTGHVMSKANPENFTFFALVNADLDNSPMVNSNKRAYLVGFGNRYIPRFGGGDNDYKPNAKPALGMDRTSGRYIDNETGPTGVNGVDIPGGANLFAYGSTTIVGHEVSTSEQYVQFEFDNYKARKSSAPITGATHAMNGPGTLGAATYSNRSLNGQMGEILAYERTLTQEEKDVVYSYLGLKYGITIDLDKTSEDVNFDYFLSDRSLVWPGNSSEIHRKYHYNVAALVRDGGAGYDNLQARSTGAGNALWMAKQNMDGTLLQFDNDMSAISWGHDSTSLTSKITYTEADEVCGPINERMRRVWLIDNSSGQADPSNPGGGHVYAPQEVTIRVGAAGFPYQGAGWQVYMLVADSEDDLYGGTSDLAYNDAANNWKQMIQGTFVRNAQGIGEHEFKFIIDQKYTYVTFGARSIGGGCDAAGFRGSKKLTFTTANWPASNRLGPNTFNLGEDFVPRVSVEFTNSARAYNNRYPRAIASGLELYGRGNSRGYAITTIDLQGKAAAASFEIADIDGRSGFFDEIEVIGYCSGGITYYPQLSYVTDANRSSYTILPAGRAKGKTPDVSNTDARGRMSVRFDYPVQTIIVKHWTSGKTSTNLARAITIGHITFTSPVPPPPVNDAGLSFSKEVPDTLSLCEEVEYVYRIYNSECTPKVVNFTDSLPAGMAWVPGSLSVGSEAISLQTEINAYGDQQKLSIQKLIVPGAQTLVFSVKAAFDNDAVEGLYGERAKITYTYVRESIEMDGEQESCDRFLGCESVGKTFAFGDPSQRNARAVTGITANRSCYSANGEVTFTININSQIDLPGVFMNINFSDTAKLVGTPPSAFTFTPTFGATYVIPDPGDEIPGNYFFEGITLAAGVDYLITFKVRMPVKELLPHKQVPRLDANGDPILDGEGNPLFDDGEEFEDLIADFEFFTDSPDVCLQEVLARANGSRYVPFCMGKDNIIINKNVTTKKRR